MKHFTLILFVLAVLSSYSQSEKLNMSYLETTAVVDSLVVPDRIYLSILIKEKDTRGKFSVEELESKMEMKLKSLDINTEKQLSISDVSSNFKKYFLKKNDVLKDKMYSLLVYDAKTAGKVIVGLEAIGVSNVYLTKTEYSRIENLKIELKKQAVIKAKKQAKTMVQPLEQNIGKAVFISDTSSSVSKALQGRASGIRIRGASSLYGSSSGLGYAKVNIDFEKIKIESGVTIKFNLE